MLLKQAEVYLCTLQLTACKIDDIESFAKKMLAEGHCIVIGLQSTGEYSVQASQHAAACVLHDVLISYDPHHHP